MILDNDQKKTNMTFIFKNLVCEDNIRRLPYHFPIFLRHTTESMSRNRHLSCVPNRRRHNFQNHDPYILQTRNKICNIPSYFI